MRKTSLALIFLAIPAAAKSKMVVQLVAERTVSMGDLASSTDLFLILPDGSHALATCFAITSPCTLEPFTPEKRRAIDCFSRTLHVNAICRAMEPYYADRKANTLIIYGSGQAVTFHIYGSWDALERGFLPKAPVSSADWEAICVDDTISSEKDRSGTCSDHGGVKIWRNPNPESKPDH